MRVLSGLLAVLALASFAIAQEEPARPGVGGSDFHKDDITYSTEVVTPHTKWAARLSGGPVKGFFIPSIEFGRDMIELMQRVDLAPTTVSIDRNWDVNCWGIGDYYGHNRGDRDDYRLVYGYVEKDLTGPAEFEVIVIPGINGWSRMTRASRDAIMKRVQEGAGLVLIHPFVGDIKGHPFVTGPIERRGQGGEGREAQAPQMETEYDTRLWEISPLVNCADDSVSEKGYPVINKDAITKGTWSIAADHFITEGLPVSLLPEGIVGGRFYKYEAAPDATVIIKSGEYPIAAVKNYGKGRVVAFAYVEEGFAPEDTSAIENRIAWNYWEYWYSMLSKSLLWAARRDGGVRIAGAEIAPQPEGYISLNLRLESDAPRAVVMETSGRSEFGPSLAAKSSREQLSSLPMAIVSMIGKHAAGGRSIYDYIIKDESGATLNWGTAVFEAPKKAVIESVTPSAEVYKSGETLSAVVQSNGDFAGVTTRFKVTDDFDRLIAQVDQPARQERHFIIPLPDYLGMYAFITVEHLDEGGNVIDAARAKPVLVVQAERRPRDFRAFLSFGGGKSYFTNLRSRLIREAGAQTGFTWGGGADNGLRVPRGTFGVYWYDRGPTDKEGIEREIEKYYKTGDFKAIPYLTRKELYARTKDKKFLERTPCFDDPEEMKSLYDIVHAVSRSKTAYNLDYYFVGDEGSLTSYTDAVDFCYGPHTLASFRKWLKKEYGTLDALNAKWKTAFTRWDDVMPLTTDEAKAAGNFVPWADHRAYMEITFANAYQTVRDAVTAADPEGHIALSGTQVTTAMNGCDWYRLDKVIDDFLAYDGGNQWDLHRSFSKPGAMIGYWTGYGSSGLSVQNAIWRAAIHNVLHPNIFWMPSYMDPDLTYSDSARDMGVAFKALKHEGVGKLLMESRRLQDGVAIHWSIATVHAATITGNEGGRGESGAPAGRSLSNDRDGWVRTVKDLGLQFDFVAYEQIEQGKLDSGAYKVLILPFSMAISPEEATAIRRFVENGGVVIADAFAGVMDDHCAWEEKGLLSDLFGVEAPDSSKRKLASPGPDFARGPRMDSTAPRIDSTVAAPAPAPEVVLTPDGQALNLDASLFRGVAVVEPELKAGAGKALLKVGGADAVIVNSYGKGKAVYLNMLLDRMGGGGGRRRQAETGPSTAAAYKALASAIFVDGGIKPVIEVSTASGAAMTRAQYARYQLGDTYVFALVKDLVGAEGIDGVTYYNDSTLGQVAQQPVVVRLPQKFHVADVRTGEKLGLTDTVRANVTVGGALVLGLTPEERQLKVEGPRSAALGEHPQFTLGLSAAGPAVVRCHFYGPDGAFLQAYARNVLLDGGKGVVVLPSALNDAPGAYTLKCTDTVSGAAAETTVILE